MHTSPRQLHARADPENPFPADCAARFRREKSLAAGGFGEVWLATQIELDRQVAVKLLHVDALEDREQRERFENEARITASLQSPYIVRIIDHGAAHGIPWIAYEYLPGRSLRRRLDDGEVAPRDALTIAAQIAEALEEAHRHGVLHRDVKPENVLEASPQHYKVTDFGIAKWGQGHQVRTKTGFVLGTPAYLAPELVRGDQPSPRSDVYALGVLLWELLVGRLPFTAESPVLMMEQHLRVEPRRVSLAKPSLPADLDDVVRRALAKDPDERYASAARMQHALQQALQRLQAPSPGAPPSRGETRAARPPTRPTGPTGRVRIEPGTSESIVAPAPAASAIGRAGSLAALMVAMAVGGVVGWVAKPMPRSLPLPSPSAPAAARSAGSIAQQEARVLDELAALVALINGAATGGEEPRPETVALLHDHYLLTVGRLAEDFETTMHGWDKAFPFGPTNLERQKAYYAKLLQLSTGAQTERLTRMRREAVRSVARGLPQLQALTRVPLPLERVHHVLRIMAKAFQAVTVTDGLDHASYEKVLATGAVGAMPPWAAAYLRAAHVQSAYWRPDVSPQRLQGILEALRGLTATCRTNPRLLASEPDRRALASVVCDVAEAAQRTGAKANAPQVAAEVQAALDLIAAAGGGANLADLFADARTNLAKLNVRLK